MQIASRKKQREGRRKNGQQLIDRRQGTGDKRQGICVEFNDVVALVYMFVLICVVFRGFVSC